MLLVYENVGHSTLASLLLKGVLDLGTVWQLVKLDDLERDALLVEEVLGLDAEWTSTLGVDHDFVASDFGVDCCSD